MVSYKSLTNFYLLLYYYYYCCCYYYNYYFYIITLFSLTVHFVCLLWYIKNTFTLAFRLYYTFICFILKTTFDALYLLRTKETLPLPKFPFFSLLFILGVDRSIDSINQSRLLNHIAVRRLSYMSSQQTQ